MILLVLLMLIPCAAFAQPAPGAVRAGDRVRVSILVPETAVDSTGFDSGHRRTGTVLHVLPESIELEGEKRAIPWAYTNRLELSTGRHGNAGKGALYGALIGLVAGVVTGVTIGRDENGGENSDNLAAEGGVALGLGGLLLGAGLGAIIGGASKTDDWREIPVAMP